MFDIEKIKASILLYAAADTIAYRNGYWKKTYKDHASSYVINLANEFFYEFIHLGGINSIDLKGWNLSINTFLNLTTIDALIDSSINNTDFIVEYKNSLKKIFMNFKTNEMYRGINMYYYDVLRKIAEDNIDQRELNYDPNSVNEMASIRTIPIGIVYHGKKNRNKLIKYSIESSMMTNNSPIGFLGGLTTALFAAFAVENIDVIKWPNMMIKILLSDEVKKYITRKTEEDYDKYILHWKKYIEFKIKDDKIIRSRADINIMNRIYFYRNEFTLFTRTAVGGSGYSCTIVAYDCLVDSTGNWEKLVIYAALNIGRGTSIGSLTAGLFGLLYKWADVPKSNLEYIENKEIINDYAERLIKLYENEN